MQGPLIVRFRVDLAPQCSVGIGKIQLLEGIARTGSLSEAARQMKMSYRRAWLLLADLNASFDQPVATASVGGRNGGGAVLTGFGDRLIEGYRRLEAQLQPSAGACFGEFIAHVKPAKPRKKLVPTASIRGRTTVTPPSSAK